MDVRTLAVAVVSGAIFGAGLTLSQMIRPEVVLSFLTFADFGLLLVMAGALVVTLLAYQLAPRLIGRPLLGGAFEKHPAVMSNDTVVGAAIFGAGWGLCGVCPGPAIAGLGAGNWPIAIACAGIFAGAWVHGRFFGRVPAGPQPAAAR